MNCSHDIVLNNFSKKYFPSGLKEVVYVKIFYVIINIYFSHTYFDQSEINLLLFVSKGIFWLILLKKNLSRFKM